MPKMHTEYGEDSLLCISLSGDDEELSHVQVPTNLFFVWRKGLQHFQTKRPPNDPISSNVLKAEKPSLARRQSATSRIWLYRAEMKMFIAVQLVTTRDPYDARQRPATNPLKTHVIHQFNKLNNNWQRYQAQELFDIHANQQSMNKVTCTHGADALGPYHGH
ncbi:hypothetical protein BD410DRAFT_805045 [Rickenella mellea]|uniref:Uncharacterized protein n=1 Tax=Rickenella mellea TaxID=50990 RepID=A0A4Y7PZQ3_9AGAM|nr:hypothetical protein BD410DRAFT_805045 [Rickenella mellea]